MGDGWGGWVGRRVWGGSRLIRGRESRGVLLPFTGGSASLDASPYRSYAYHRSGYPSFRSRAFPSFRSSACPSYHSSRYASKGLRESSACCVCPRPGACWHALARACVRWWGRATTHLPLCDSHHTSPPPPITTSAYRTPRKPLHLPPSLPRLRVREASNSGGLSSRSEPAGIFCRGRADLPSPSLRSPLSERGPYSDKGLTLSETQRPSSASRFCSRWRDEEGRRWRDEQGGGRSSRWRDEQGRRKRDEEGVGRTSRWRDEEGGRWRDAGERDSISLTSPSDRFSRRLASTLPRSPGGGLLSRYRAQLMQEGEGWGTSSYPKREAVDATPRGRGSRWPLARMGRNSSRASHEERTSERVRALPCGGVASVGNRGVAIGFQHPLHPTLLDCCPFPSPPLSSPLHLPLHSRPLPSLPLTSRPVPSPLPSVGSCASGREASIASVGLRECSSSLFARPWDFARLPALPCLGEWEGGKSDRLRWRGHPIRSTTKCSSFTPVCRLCQS